MPGISPSVCPACVQNGILTNYKNCCVYLHPNRGTARKEKRREKTREKRREKKREEKRREKKRREKKNKEIKRREQWDTVTM